MPQPPPPTASFIEANTFIGPKPGYVFKSGPRGVGYYRDGAATAKREARTETKVQEAVDEDLDELD